MKTLSKSEFEELQKKASFTLLYITLAQLPGLAYFGYEVLILKETNPNTMYFVVGWLIVSGFLIGKYFSQKYGFVCWNCQKSFNGATWESGVCSKCGTKIVKE